MDSVEELAAEYARSALGQHLRALRERRGWLQETLHKESGVSVATIRSIENCYEGRRPTPRTLSLLSKGLGLPDDYLCDYLENPPAKRPSDSVEEPVGEPEAINVASLRADWDPVALRLDEIVVKRLKEIVVPRLEMVENRVRELADVIRNSGREIETYVKHPGGTE